MCPSCGGRAVTVAMLRNLLVREAVNELWQRARSDAAPRIRRCPACPAPMAEVRLPEDLSALTVDVCTRCQTVWFDAAEYERLPPLPQTQKTESKPLPPEAQERIAEIEMKIIQDRYDRKYKDGTWGNTPDSYWKYIPAMFGLPVELESESKSGWPWVT